MSPKHDPERSTKKPKAKAKKVAPEHELMLAALAYAEEGIPVFPLRPGSKIPFAESAGFHDASTDLDLVRSWWTDYPDANIGIPTGKASGLWVYDVDMGPGKRGRRSHEKLVDKHGAMPYTRTIKTPSGGRHLIFKYPDGPGEWRNSASRLGKDIDARGEGGYIAAYPSRLASGGRYELVDPKAPIAEMPKWLRKKARYEEPKVAPRLRLDAKSIPDELRPRLESWTTSAIDGEVHRLAKMQQAAVPKGETYRGEPWDNTTYTVACRLVEIAAADWSPVTEEDVLELFLANAPRDRGFGPKEHARIWESALKKAGAKELPIPVEVESLVLMPLPKRRAADGALVTAADPDSFIDRKEGLLAAKVADAIGHDLAIGADGLFWEYAPTGVWEKSNDVVRTRLARLLGDRYRSGMTVTIEDVVRASPEVIRLSGDPHEELINTRSGMYEWRTGKLLEHSPEYLSTVQLPVELDPADTECPRFDAWLERALPADTIPLLWEVLGYMLLNGNPLQKAILLHGDGGNGKGVFLRLLLAMLGSHNTSSITLRDMTEGKFEVAGLFGKIANVAGDIDALYLRDSAKFKSLTGQDKVNAQHKRKDPFEFVCWAVPIFSANELWRSSDTSRGYFRRWVVVPFPNALEGADDDFTEARLHREAPAIFLKAMDALRGLMQRGRFELGISAAMLRDDFESQSDTVRIWLMEDESVKTSTPGDLTTWEKRSSVYDAFRQWGTRSGQPVISSTKFYRRLRQLGFTETRRDGYAGFYGIALNTLVAYPVGGGIRPDTVSPFEDPEEAAS